MSLLFHLHFINNILSQRIYLFSSFLTLHYVGYKQSRSMLDILPISQCLSWLLGAERKTFRTPCVFYHS